MTASSETMYNIYFKIPFTEFTYSTDVPVLLTTEKLIEKVNLSIRSFLHISSKYDIELVDVGQPDGELAPHIEPRDDETLIQRYGNANRFIAMYVRPVGRVTRHFPRRITYSD